METANMLRVNARSGSYAGHGNSSHDKQQQQRQKLLALLEAIQSGHLEAAKQAFQALVNGDANLLSDAHFVRLSKCLASANLYQAQQCARDIKSAWVNAQPLAAHPKPHAQAPAFRPDGLHVVDLRA